MDTPIGQFVLIGNFRRRLARELLVVQLSFAEQSVELEAENWRLCSTTLVRGVPGELEAENWRLCSTTLGRGAIWGAGS